LKNSERTTYYWNDISRPVIQCCPAQRILPGSKESNTGYPYFEGREISKYVNILPAKRLLQIVSNFCEKAALKKAPESG
jgi:hypothetical protein